MAPGSRGDPRDRHTLLADPGCGRRSASKIAFLLPLLLPRRRRGCATARLLPQHPMIRRPLAPRIGLPSPPGLG